MINSLLVGINLPFLPIHKVEEYLNELKSLAETAGAVEVERIIQKRDKIDPAYFIGEGKAKEIGELCKKKKIKLIIFDEELSPSQVKNLEKVTNVKVIDRTGLILDIFAKRARTREAKMQVSLAQYNYLLPRLTGAWEHLSRQAGGIGTRGVGETQLETDRRVIRDRIRKLSSDIKKLHKRREVQSRRRENAFIVAVVGYTNVGKTTLLNALTKSKLFSEDKLFATLDTTFRRMKSKEYLKEILIVDTIGFIRKLPLSLVASFRSTLSEIKNGDLILNIVDISHPEFEEQVSVVKESLAELECGDIPLMNVFNKIDVAPEPFLERARGLYPDSIEISAKTKKNLDVLTKEIIKEAERSFDGIIVKIPYQKIDKYNQFKDKITILKEEYLDKYLKANIRGRKEDLKALTKIFK